MSPCVIPHWCTLISDECVFHFVVDRWWYWSHQSGCDDQRWWAGYRQEVFFPLRSVVWEDTEWWALLTWALLTWWKYSVRALDHCLMESVCTCTVWCIPTILAVVVCLYTACTLHVHTHTQPLTDTHTHTQSHSRAHVHRRTHTSWTRIADHFYDDVFLLQEQTESLLAIIHMFKHLCLDISAHTCTQGLLLCVFLGT